MATWGQLIQEIQAAGGNIDVVRKKHVAALSALTGNDTIVYATRWTLQDAPPQLISITPEDLNGLMEMMHGFRGDKLDLILHSPGGQPAAAEAFVTYMRSKFKRIRVIVPHMAMSAATMIACGADEIVMGKHSFLGPIDPQMNVQLAGGVVRQVPAQALVDEFRRARRQCTTPSNSGAWVALLQHYPPGLLEECRYATALSKQLVQDWLAQYMFAGERGRRAKAKGIADWLGSHDGFKSHNRPIGRAELKTHGLNIVDLEQDQRQQDAFLTVFHACMHTFNMLPIAKMMENNLGRSYFKAMGGVPMGMAKPRQLVPGGPVPSAPGLLPRTAQPKPNAAPAQPASPAANSPANA